MCSAGVGLSQERTGGVPAMAGQGWALSPAQCRPGDSKHGTTERRRREQQEDEVLDDARSRTDQSWIFGQSLGAVCTVPSSHLFPLLFCRNMGVSNGHIQSCSFDRPAQTSRTRLYFFRLTQSLLAMIPGLFKPSSSAAFPGSCSRFCRDKLTFPLTACLWVRLW